MKYLGIDVGGTKIAAAVTDEKGRILAQSRCPTDVKHGCIKFADDIYKTVLKLLNENDIKIDEFQECGVGVPGTIDTENGIVRYASNLYMKDVPLGELLTQRMGIQVNLENDANCAALGEYNVQPDKDKIKNFFMVTLGTGIGSGWVINGNLFKGVGGLAPEVGHTTIEAHGIPCVCGNIGCWEMYCAGHALQTEGKRLAGILPKSKMNILAEKYNCEINGKIIFEAWKQGDDGASRVIERYLEYLGMGISNIVNGFGPQVIVLGGGISEDQSILLETAQRAAKEGSYCKNIEVPEIRHAILGGSAGLVGAAFLKRKK